eukprot:1144592-Pelagomonas_calceolata.AAC.1
MSPNNVIRRSLVIRYECQDQALSGAPKCDGCRRLHVSVFPLSFPRRLPVPFQDLQDGSASEYQLTDRPYTMLCLAKTYAPPVSVHIPVLAKLSSASRHSFVTLSFPPILGSLRIMRELVVDFSERLHGVWNADALAEHSERKK